MQETTPAGPSSAQFVLPVALLLTIITGFSGLVYEVAWQKYAATLLGSHSEVTASVLGFFLGGLSLGSLECPGMRRWSRVEQKISTR